MWLQVKQSGSMMLKSYQRPSSRYLYSMEEVPGLQMVSIGDMREQQTPCIMDHTGHCVKHPRTLYY